MRILAIVVLAACSICGFGIAEDQPKAASRGSGKLEHRAIPSSIVPVPQCGKMRAEQYAALHKRVKKLNPDALPRVAFLGDSITEGWTETGAESWTKYFEPLGAINLGMGGDETQHVLWRIDHGSFVGYEPTTIVLMIGTNNLANSGHTPGETSRGVQAVLSRLRDKFSEAHILLIGVLPRGASSTDPMRDRVIKLNQKIQLLADGKHVHYLDVGFKFLEKDGSIHPNIMPDALHLSSAGYERLAEAISDKVHELARRSEKGT